MKDAETVFTDRGDTLVVTERENEITLTVLSHKGVGAEITLDADAIQELQDALGALDV